MKNNLRVCTRCVMNSTASKIYFNDDGICNYCNDFEKKLNDYLENKPLLENLVSTLKKNKKNKYDCIIGLSGGVDSCFSVHKAVQIGLNPLVVHLDNGWNSELAQNNIENLVKTLYIDLYTYVINWNEYKNFMNAFFDANVIDIELLMDNAMLAVNYREAAKYDLKYILAGTNISSEGMAMPENMNWIKFDKKNIKNIIKRFGGYKLSTYPAIGTSDLVYYILIKKIKWLSFLDYFDYDKFKAIEILKEKYNFKPYPYKHYESIFTRFYQGYILPKKFNIDKRILHYSTLIMSKSMTREFALKELQNEYAYSSNEQLELDKEYFLKKMSWSEEKLENYLNRPGKSHLSYPNEKKFYDVALKFYNFFK